MTDRRRTVLITGASRGIGHAICHGMAKAGYRVIATDVDELKLANTVQNIHEQDRGDIIGIKADLRHTDEIERLVDRAYRKFGRIDILINNAVIRHEAAVEDIKFDKWSDTLAVNLTAPLWLCKLLIPNMKRARWGRIINLSSIYSRRAEKNRAGYVTTKTALLGLTRAVAYETAGFGITCNAIAPGTVLTETIRAKLESYASREGITFEEQSARYLREKQLTRRFISYESIVSAVMFLCSDSGSDVTGIDIPIDGGWGIS